MDGYCSRSPLTLIYLFLQIIEILAPLVSTGFTDFVVLYDKFGEQGGLPVCCGTAVLCSGMTVISLVSFSPRIVLVFCQVAGLWRTGQLTSAGIVLHEELIQSAPTSAHTNHHGGPQDPHQTQLLGISKLKMGNHEYELFHSETQTQILPGIFPLRPGRP